MDEILIDNEFGVAEGYIVNTEKEQLLNWMHVRHKGVGDVQRKEEIINIIQNKCQNIAFLNSLSVHEDCRGQGKGNEILEEFIDSAYESNADTVLLFPDIYEKNNFDLIKWFSSYGFEMAIGDEETGCIMIVNWDSIKNSYEFEPKTPGFS